MEDATTSIDTINTADIAKEISQRTSVSQGLARDIVGIVFDAIAGGLRQGREVRIYGFGSFRVTQRAASTGRNPRTGEAIAIPAKRSVKLRVARVVQEAMNPVATGRTRRRA
jgi:DNA-binding protein HU-beta